VNFFEHQDDARRTTRRLIVLFSLAVLSILFITNLAIIVSLWFFDASLIQEQNQRLQNLPYGSQSQDYLQFFLSYFKLEQIAKISLLVVVVIGTVIFFKRSELAGGGKVIAKRLGGKQISPDTKDFNEKRILNVVEEMAIASGIAVPPVYLLPENSINAFAAGFETSDAVIGISKGAIEGLNRDELQGVVAHEFSHILNGDMRLNINLIAVLAGILFIGHSGWFVIRTFGYSRRSRRDSGSAFAIVGMLLVFIGFLGTFFGKLIKAAVSRQREFLADASAVQFTRNPEGISGALKKIGGSQFGSRMLAAHSEEMSHLFFGEALSNRLSFSNMMATHPPLEDRIKRVEPRWDGKYISPVPIRKTIPKAEKQQENRLGKAAVAASVIGGAIVASADADAVKQKPPLSSLEQSLESVGGLTEENCKEAQRTLDKIKEDVFTAIHKKDPAKQLIYILLLNEEANIKARQFDYLKKENENSFVENMNKLMAVTGSIKKAERLNLIELSMPALKTMGKAEYGAFIKQVVFLVKADEEIDLFEWLLHSLLIYYLKPNFEKVKPKKSKYKNLSRLRNECKFLLSHLTYAGCESGEVGEIDFQKVFSEGFVSLDLGDTAIAPREQLKLQDLNGAMFHFSHLYPLVKPKLLKACAKCIQADGNVNVEQYELLRVLAALLDCPMPLMHLEVEHG
jgi:Zn-dependent protease with chaperone function